MLSWISIWIPLVHSMYYILYSSHTIHLQKPKTSRTFKREKVNFTLFPSLNSDHSRWSVSENVQILNFKIEKKKIFSSPRWKFIKKFDLWLQFSNPLATKVNDRFLAGSDLLILFVFPKRRCFLWVDPRKRRFPMKLNFQFRIAKNSMPFQYGHRIGVDKHPARPAQGSHTVKKFFFKNKNPN